MLITIARKCGCRGDEIGNGLADYYDLCLNVTELGVEGTLRIIDAYWKEKYK